MTEADKARKYWRTEHGECVCCEQSPVVGAHVYGAGPYPHFKGLICNGFGMCPECHDELDQQRPVANKISWLRGNVSRKYREHVEFRLDALAEVVRIYRAANRGAIK